MILTIHRDNYKPGDEETWTCEISDDASLPVVLEKLEGLLIGVGYSVDRYSMTVTAGGGRTFSAGDDLP